GQERRVVLAGRFQKHLEEAVRGHSYELALGHLRPQGVGQDLAVDPYGRLALDHCYSSFRLLRTISRPRSASAAVRSRVGRKRSDRTPLTRRRRPFAIIRSWAFLRIS